MGDAWNYGAQVYSCIEDGTTRKQIQDLTDIKSYSGNITGCIQGNHYIKYTVTGDQEEDNTAQCNNIKEGIILVDGSKILPNEKNCCEVFSIEIDDGTFSVIDMYIDYDTWINGMTRISEYITLFEIG
jgi:hypothetical protein